MEEPVRVVERLGGHGALGLGCWARGGRGSDAVWERRAAWRGVLWGGV